MISSHGWRGKNGVVCDLVLWEPRHGKKSIVGQACICVDLLEADSRAPRDCFPAAMDDRVGWRKSTMGNYDI